MQILENKGYGMLVKAAYVQLNYTPIFISVIDTSIRQHLDYILPIISEMLQLQKILI